MKRVKRLLVLLVLLLAPTQMSAKAQVPVVDPMNDFINFGVEVGNFAKDLGIKYQQFSDLYQKIAMPLELANSVYDVTHTLGELRQELALIATDVNNFKYLTPSEKMRFVNLYKNRLLAIKSLSGNIGKLLQKQFLSGAGTHMSLGERAQQLREMTNEFQSMVYALRSSYNSVQMMNKQRANQAYERAIFNYLKSL